MNAEVVKPNQRDFKGVFIPKEIWCNPELTGDEKMMWGEIYALDNDFGCIASNEHFMEIFSFANERKAQRLIKSLKDKGYVTVEIDKRKDDRIIRVVGKFRHLDKDEMRNLDELKKQLTAKMRNR